MSVDSGSSKAARLLHELQHNEALKHRRMEGAALDPRLTLLRTWQSERLTQTYADLLNDKRYRPPCLFFLSDIYAPRDFSQRNHDAERVHDFLAPVVPPKMLQLLTDVIELNTLTDDLDDRLIHVLVDNLGVTETIIPQNFAEGYRICDNYAERVQQIDLITKIVVQLAEGARLLIVGIDLKIIRGPAQRAGWVELYDFLKRGYEAFKPIHDAKFFAGTIEQREKALLDQIFANPG
jgi:hypothetical protein